MQIIKNLFAGVGMLVVLLIALLLYLVFSTGDYTEDHKPFIENFMQDLSAEWQIKDVESKLTPSLIKELDSTDGHQVLLTFHPLGQYQSMTALAVSQYQSNTIGNVARFRFTGNFTNGSAVVDIHLIEQDGQTLVNGIYITPENTKILSNPERRV